MSSSAQQALAIDEALESLHALHVEDDADAIVVRDILSACMQLRNAAVHAASRKRSH